MDLKTHRSIKLSISLIVFFICETIFAGWV